MLELVLSLLFPKGYCTGVWFCSTRNNCEYRRVKWENIFYPFHNSSDDFTHTQIFLLVSLFASIIWAVAQVSSRNFVMLSKTTGGKITNFCLKKKQEALVCLRHQSAWVKIEYTPFNYFFIFEYTDTGQEENTEIFEIISENFQQFGMEWNLFHLTSISYSSCKSAYF